MISDLRIKSHKQLADHIKGKRILHLNSLGKDSLATLLWCARYARPEHITSVFFEFIAKHPSDDRYFDYLRQHFPHVEFIRRPNTEEANYIRQGVFQRPQVAMNENKYEYFNFDRTKQIDDLQKEFNLEYACLGHSKYEGVQRSKNFYSKGLCYNGAIYPIGLMTRAEIISIIKGCGVKLHPSYLANKGTFDHPSYFKMRNGFLIWPEYEKTVLSVYPLLVLDKFRYERMF